MTKPVFGFDAGDKDILLRVADEWASTAGQSVAENRRPQLGFVRARTKTGGLAAASMGKVYYMEPIGSAPFFQVTSIEIDVCNEGAAIAGSKDLVLIPINGRWWVLELCS